jgi:hypothetical protein
MPFEHDLHSEILAVKGEGAVQVRDLKGDVRQPREACIGECEVGGPVRTHRVTITWDRGVSDTSRHDEVLRGVDRN